MSDQNRIHTPGQPPAPTEQPLNLGMTHEGGCVQMTFNPPVVRMRLQPREARTLAIALLSHADLAEHPPIIIPPSGS
jgi:hypothetical protein